MKVSGRLSFWSKDMAKDFDALDWLTKHQPANHSVCSYYIETDKGDSQHHNDICHARANNGAVKYYIAGCKEIIALHSALPTSTSVRSYAGWSVTYEESSVYYDYIFDKEKSPYRQMLKNVKTYRDEKDNHYIGFSLLDTDVPNAMVGSFLIASRTPWEQAWRVQSFCKMIEAGFKEAEAFVICQTTNFTRNKLTLDYRGGHNIMGGRTYDYGKAAMLRYSITNIHNGTLRVDAVRGGGNSYRKLTSSSQWWKMYEGVDPDTIHPFDCDFKNVEMCYYTGKFGVLAKQDVNFPLALPLTGAQLDEKILTIRNLLDTRKQWSPL